METLASPDKIQTLARRQGRPTLTDSSNRTSRTSPKVRREMQELMLIGPTVQDHFLKILLSIWSRTRYKTIRIKSRPTSSKFQNLKKQSSIWKRVTSRGGALNNRVLRSNRQFRWSSNNYRRWKTAEVRINCRFTLRTSRWLIQIKRIFAIFTHREWPSASQKPKIRPLRLTVISAVAIFPELQEVVKRTSISYGFRTTEHHIRMMVTKPGSTSQLQECHKVKIWPLFSKTWTIRLSCIERA